MVTEQEYEAALDVLGVLDEHECECKRCWVIGVALVDLVVAYERAVGMPSRL